MTDEPTTIYLPITQLSTVTGLPAAYLKRLTDQGALPYLEPLPHKRFYCLDDVAQALSRLAHANMKQVTETPIDYGEFSARVTKVLKLRGIASWEQLATTAETDLLSAPNFGRGCLREVQAKLAARNKQGTLWATPQESATNSGTEEPRPTDTGAVHES
jgi:hypothetical protein